MSSRHAEIDDEPETTGEPALPRPHLTGYPSFGDNQFAGSTEHPNTYELIGAGTKGGEGVVWRALDHRLRAPAVCAVKMLTPPHGAAANWPAPADRHALEDTKHLLQHLSPEHIVRVYDIIYGPPPHPRGRAETGTPESAYLIMEWVDGPTLRQLVAGRPATSGTLMERLRHVAQLAGAVDELMPMNANATAHCDIKPGNCIIHHRRGLILIDVTTLRAAGDGYDPHGLHTPEYAAPEVRANPRRPHNTATEMYSLAAVGAFCITGADPAADHRNLTGDLIRDAADAGVGDPEAFVRHLTAPLAADPADRPLDPMAWSDTLLRLAVGTHGRQPSPPQSAAPVRRARRWWFLAATAAALIGLGTTASYLTSRSDDDTRIATTIAGGPTDGTSAATAPSAAVTPTGSADPATTAAPRPTHTDRNIPAGHGSARTPTSKPATTTANGSIVDASTSVKSCAYFSGTATLPPGTSLILTKRNTTTSNPDVYAELVYHWDEPSKLVAWRGAQYFGPGEESVDQNYEVGLRAVPMSAAKAFHDSKQNDHGLAISKVGVQLDAITAERVSGEGPGNGGCPGS